MAYVSLQLNLPPPLIQAGALLAGPPLPSSERTYFMDEPLDFLYYKIQWGLEMDKNETIVARQMVVKLDLSLHARQDFWYFQVPNLQS